MGQGTSLAVASWIWDDDVTVVLLWHMNILTCGWSGGCWAHIKAPVLSRYQSVSLWGERPLWFFSVWAFLLTPTASDPAEQFPVTRPSWESNAHGTFILHFQDGEKYNSVIEATHSITFCYENLRLCQSGKGNSIAQCDNMLHLQEWCDQPKEKRSHVGWQCDVEEVEHSHVSDGNIEWYHYCGK